jgi:hypothetical protein
VGLTMAERRAVTRQMVARYERGSKKLKGQVLDELCALTGWHRDHARKALRRAARGSTVSPRSRLPAPRPRAYGEDVLVPLRRIWATLDAPAGKRLAPFMAEAVEAMERAGELKLHPDVRQKLLRVSAATIDRLLAPERRRLRVKGALRNQARVAPRRQIPIRTFAEWDEARPGFFEADLVAHDGGDPRGEFCHTLTLTDVATGWTEVRALRNKAQRWVHEALQQVAAELPFPLVGLDSDNGSGVHQQQPVLLVPGARSDVHPLSAVAQERQLLRGAEELGRRPPSRGVPALRHSRGAPGPAPALPSAPAVRELLSASDEASRKDQGWSEGAPPVRPAPDPIPPDPRLF